MSIFIKTFQQLNKSDIYLAGGKGASLGEMMRAGILIPPGFVVTSLAFDYFLMETDLNQKIESQLDNVNYDDVNSLDLASKKIRDLIYEAKLPEDLQCEILNEFNDLEVNWVAVRSSATAEDSLVASWAGVLESYLNTDKNHLLCNIKKCWASLFTSMAICYRQKKGLCKTKVSVAVVIQAMIQADVAGICFTVHPVTKDKNQMIIEAGYGLGKAIVSGQITPDSYIINKNNFEIIEINIAKQDKMLVRSFKSGNKRVEVQEDKREKQKLSSKQIMELAKICLKIEKHYGFPCDIEWAMLGKFKRWKFFIMQIRPVTT